MFVLIHRWISNGLWLFFCIKVVVKILVEHWLIFLELWDLEIRCFVFCWWRLDVWSMPVDLHWFLTSVFAEGGIMKLTLNVCVRTNDWSYLIYHCSFHLSVSNHLFFFYFGQKPSCMVQSLYVWSVLRARLRSVYLSQSGSRVIPFTFSVACTAALHLFEAFEMLLLHAPRPDLEAVLFIHFVAAETLKFQNRHFSIVSQKLSK